MAAAATGVALVHEWLSARAGSEKTFEQMTKVLPHADVYALTVDRSADFDIDAPVRTTVLQRVPVLRDRRSLSLPLMPLAWKTLRTRRYHTVITSAHAFARCIPAAKRATHLSYVYTPLRYAWLPTVDRRAAAVSRALGPARAALRALDRTTVRHVDRFAAISNAVRERIEEFYGREATVIFPPVDIDFFATMPPTSEQPPVEPYVLGFSRWIPYKRLDLVIAAGAAVGMPVVIAGHGPEEAALREAAERSTVPVRFETSPDDVRLRALYRGAAALMFPAEEDFGIVPVEAQAAGTPVVALARGGSIDTVRSGVTGVLVPSQDVDEMADGLRRCLALPRSPEVFADHVAKFSVASFRRSFAEWITPW
ncbi:MAG: glycosyltransferase, partial [Acidimicrobiales bacterium]